MPSFVCDFCQETLKKPKLDGHTQRCRNASFSCIDCYKSFQGNSYREHFTCITEVEKYEKKKIIIPPENFAFSEKNISKEKGNPSSLEKKTDNTEGSSMTDIIASVLKKEKKPLSLGELKTKVQSRGIRKSKLKKEFLNKIAFSYSKKEETIKLEFI